MNPDKESFMVGIFYTISHQGVIKDATKLSEDGYHAFMRPTRRACAEQRGSLLTEVLIALALLIPVVVLVAGLFPYSFSVDRKAWNERSAQSLARSEIEECRGRKFEDIPALTNLVVVKDGTTFSIETRVDDISPPGREKDVKCTVTWPAKHGTGQLVLQSKIAKLYQGLDD